MRSFIVTMMSLILSLGSAVYADLVSHYTFDTDASDAQGLRNGTFTPGGGTAAITNVPADIKIGIDALDVSGMGYVDLPGGAAALNGLTSWTIGAWVKVTGTHGGTPNEAIFVTDAWTNTDFHAYYVPGSSNGTLEAQTFGGLAISSTGVPAVPTGWFHYAAVRNGAAINLYLNGQLLASDGLNSASTNLGNDASIGASAPLDRHLIGQIDDLRIYDHALTPMEIGSLPGVNAPLPPTQIKGNLGYVVVSPNGPKDGGDFGPYTPGTQTSGLQEAFVYAKANTKEVFIVGGAVGADPVVYDLDATLTIPWGQDWHCDGGNYALNFTITNGDCMVIDSQMNCIFRFGIISAPNLQSGSIVKVAPTSVGPDGLILCASTMIDIAGIVGGGDPSGGTPGSGTGLELNSSDGEISSSKFSVGEIVGCQTGILLDGGHHNKIDCPFVHVCNTHLQVNSGSHADVTSLFKPDGITGTVIGANLAGGDQNHYTLTWLDSYTAGNALMFGTGAQDNLVYAMNLPVDGITNIANPPTNRIVPLKSPGFNITTPPVPVSGGNVVNNTCYSVVVTILTAGSVSSWTVTDVNGTPRTVTGALFAGQSIYLGPGDAISLQYSSAPVWAWRALR